MVKSALIISLYLIGPILLVGHMALILLGFWKPGPEGPLILVFLIAISLAAGSMAESLDTKAE